MFNWIKNIYVLKRVKDLEIEVAQLRTEINNFEISVFDKLTATTDKISKRIATKMKRDDNKELPSEKKDDLDELRKINKDVEPSKIGL